LEVGRDQASGTKKRSRWRQKSPVSVGIKQYDMKNFITFFYFLSEKICCYGVCLYLEVPTIS